MTESEAAVWQATHASSSPKIVMLSESEASAFPTAHEKADSSAAPQNDILTQSLKGATNGARSAPTGAYHAPVEFCDLCVLYG